MSGHSHPPLTKSEFIRGLECPKRLWLDRHKPGLRPPHSIAIQERIETGKRIQALAEKRYVDAAKVPYAGEDPDQAAKVTKEYLESDARHLLESTFVAEGRHVRADVLSRSPDGGWIIEEIKSSSVKEPKRLAKEDEAWDLAFQVLTARKAGIEVKGARLVLVDTSYVWSGEDYDPSSMLGVVDLTAECEELIAEAEERSEELLQILLNPSEPDAEINTHCKRCEYYSVHCGNTEQEHDIIHLPAIRPVDVRKLREEGYPAIRLIPDDYKLTDRRRRMRDVVVTGQPFIGEGLAEALDAVKFPAAFVDYESSNPAFPLYPGTRPYQQVCFQWSAHIMAARGGAPSHLEFLACDPSDPREEFCRTLWEAVKDCASIVHYTDFEITQLKAMVRDGIPYAEQLLAAIEERTVDLHKIVAEHLYLPAFNGRTTIKVVLPALVPEMTYKDLEIADGTAAASAYRLMLAPNTSQSERVRLRQALLSYCRQDTLAMVEIYESLETLTKH